MLKEKVINTIIKSLILSSDVNKSIIEIVIQSDFEIVKSKPKNGTKTYFYKQKISPKLIVAIHNEAIKILRKKKDVMEMDDLYSAIANRFAPKGLKVEKTLIDSSLEVFDDLVK
jgi:TPP-dependent 2-oxoacid decarboxylase